MQIKNIQPGTWCVFWNAEHEYFLIARYKERTRGGFNRAYTNSREFKELFSFAAPVGEKMEQQLGIGNDN